MSMIKTNFLTYSSLVSPKKDIKKMAILGDSAVGKTSLAERFVNSKFDPKYNLTVAGNFLIKKIPTANEKPEILIISDIAGQSRFEEVRTAFFMGAEVILAVCDLTRRKTLNNLETLWIPEFLDKNPPKNGLKTKIQLIGNKCDLEDLIVISMSDLEKIAMSIGRKFQQVSVLMPCLMTSAKENLLIDEAFGTKKKLDYSLILKKI